MNKVKFVQVSTALSSDGMWSSEYVDDKGRIWERGAQGFKLIESPDEPKGEQNE